MTSLKDPPGAKGVQAQDHRLEFRKMFSEVRRMMVFYAVTPGKKGVLTSQLITQKLDELQSLQVLLLKAEEALYDQSYTTEDGVAIDLETLRDQIGRKLDRIRAVLDAGEVS